MTAVHITKGLMSFWENKSKTLTSSILITSILPPIYYIFFIFLLTCQLLVFSIYLSFRSCDSCRRLLEPKHHSFLFSHWSSSKCLVFMAARSYTFQPRFSWTSSFSSFPLVFYPSYYTHAGIPWLMILHTSYAFKGFYIFMMYI